MQGSLNIPKKVDIRGFKHSAVEEQGRGGGNKHRGVQKSNNKNYRASSEACCPFTRPVDRFFYSLTIPKKVDFRDFEHSAKEERGRGGGNKHRGVQKSKRLGWGPKNMKIFYSLNIPKRLIFGVLSTQTCRKGPGEVGTSFGESKKAIGWGPKNMKIFYSLNIPKKVDIRGFKHSAVEERGRGGGDKHRGVQKSTHKFIALRAGPAARLPAMWTVFSTASTFPKRLVFGVLSTQPWRSGAGQVGTSIGESKKATTKLSRFERSLLPVYPPCGPFFLQPQHTLKGRFSGF
ncbi:hypothetical protein ACOMHN_002803 [Nucella lapillus]